MPARGVPDGPVPRLSRRQRDRDGAAPCGLAAGRAAEPRRGVRRPRGGAARRPRGADRDGVRRGAAGEGDRGDRRAHRVGRDRELEVHRQGGQRPRQAGRARRRASGHRAGAAPPDARHRHPRRGAGDGGAAAPGGHPHGCRARVGQPRRAGPPGRQGPRRGSLRAGPGGRRPARRAGPGDQVRQLRGHLRHRPDRPFAHGAPAHPAGDRRRDPAAQAAVSPDGP